MENSNDETDDLSKYLDCMQEIALRLIGIKLKINELKVTCYKYIEVEFICLQFRKILEFIALANLVSNKEEYAKKHQNFANHYHAKHILRDIEEINPNFYPQPIQFISTDEIPQQVADIESGYLTKEEFLHLYNECSEFLHAKNPFAAPKDLEKFYPECENWLNKIFILLYQHQTQLIDTKQYIWVDLFGEDGYAQGHVMESIFNMNNFDDNLKSHLKNYNPESEKCPDHGKISKFTSPSKLNQIDKKLIVNFECPDGHQFTREFYIK